LSDTGLRTNERSVISYPCLLRWLARGYVPNMAVRASCRACRARVTIPDGFSEHEVPEQTRILRCYRCGGEIAFDPATDGGASREYSAVQPSAGRAPQEDPRPSESDSRDRRGQSPICEEASAPSPGRQSGPSPALAAETQHTATPGDPYQGADPLIATLPPLLGVLIGSGGAPGNESKPVVPEPLEHDVAEFNDEAPTTALNPVVSGNDPRRDLVEPSPGPQPASPAPGQDEWPDEPRPAQQESERAPLAAILPLRHIGRYSVFEPIASGGMANVHVGRLFGAAGFSRIVAIKRLHPHLLEDPGFAEMFVTEARLAARVRHSNVVEILDVIADQHEIALVMEYIAGESLVALVRSAAKGGEALPLDIAAGILVGVLQGLHAAHQARDERGQALSIVHRDVSPHNVLVGADGVARVFDFGIAKAIEEEAEQTDPGLLKGKASYMAPEQIQGGPLTRAADIFAAGVVGWELLTGKKLFGGRDNAERLYKILNGNYPRPREFQAEVPVPLEDAVMRAMARDPQDRFATALEFAEAVEHATPLASPRTIGNWVASMAKETLAMQAELMKRVEALPPESSAPIAVRIAEEGLGTSPPAVVHRNGWFLALGGIVIGAVLVVLIWLLAGSSDSVAPPEAVFSAEPSLALDEPSATAAEPAGSLSAAAATSAETAPTAPPGWRVQPRAHKPKGSRDVRGFRPTEL
jgi:serine/threonine protein kinase